MESSRHVNRFRRSRLAVDSISSCDFTSKFKQSAMVTSSPASSRVFEPHRRLGGYPPSELSVAIRANRSSAAQDFDDKPDRQMEMIDPGLAGGHFRRHPVHRTIRALGAGDPLELRAAAALLQGALLPSSKKPPRLCMPVTSSPFSSRYCPAAATKR